MQNFDGLRFGLRRFASSFGGGGHNSILADNSVGHGEHASYNRVAMLLYYITDRRGFEGNDTEQRTGLLRCIVEVARAGADYIQLREKDLRTVDLELLAREALHVVRENSVTTKLLINTHTDIALAIGADGVHLPGGSPPASTIRAAWLDHSRRPPLIGVSAHSVVDVQLAEGEDADFAVLAPIFEKAGTAVKGIGPDVLRKACNESRLPVLALGGVNIDNARACLDAGVAGIAGIRLFQLGDVAETVKRLREMSKATK